MNVVSNFFKSDKISPLHADRVAEVAKRREALAEKRQELVWAQQRKLEDFDGTEGKAVSDYEAAIAAFEVQREAEIAKEAITTLRSATSTFGDAPRSATPHIRNAWRNYVKRVREELGTLEPNLLLLAAAFVAPDYEHAIATPMFLANKHVSGDLGRAILALTDDSVPEATYAMQMLDISVDKAALESVRTYPEEAAAASAEPIKTCSTMQTLRSRVMIDYRLTDNLVAAFQRLIPKPSKEDEAIAFYERVKKKAGTREPGSHAAQEWLTRNRDPREKADLTPVEMIVASAGAAKANELSPDDVEQFMLDNPLEVG